MPPSFISEAPSFISEESLDCPTHVSTALIVPASPFALPPLPLSTSPDKDLSERETEVLAWIAEGKSDWEIANILVISRKTVNFHVENAKRKLAASTRLQAVIRAVRLGLVVVLACLNLVAALSVDAVTLVPHDT